MAEKLKIPEGVKLSSREKAQLFQETFGGKSPRIKLPHQANKITDSKDRGHRPHTTYPKPI